MLCVFTEINKARPGFYMVCILLYSIHMFFFLLLLNAFTFVCFDGQKSFIPKIVPHEYEIDGNANASYT